MKFITKLEKSKIFWSIFLISVVFFVLRLPSLIEPNWYGDEGVYQIVGRVLNAGGLLYRDVWDNKPPLLYLIYALAHGDQFITRFASLGAGLATTWVFFFFARKLFDNMRVSVIATAIFAVLFALPLIEGNIANAENFMLLPILTAAFLIYKNSNPQTNHSPFGINPKLFLAGLLVGLAFLLKIVAVFDLAAFIVFLFLVNFPFTQTRRGGWNLDKAKLKKEITDKLALVAGFAIPVVITVLYFVFNYAFTDFIRATLFGNVGYVGYGNKLIIPQGLLIIKLLLLSVFLIYLTVKRAKFSHAALFILIWTAFSVFNALFSQRPYTHYVLVLLPSFCLLIGLILAESKKNLKRLFMLLLLLVVVIMGFSFKLYSLKKTFLYYQNAYLFVAGQKSVRAYEAFFDGKTPRDYELASYLKMHLPRNEHILVWGDSPQIYVLSNTLPLNRYVAAYHVTADKNGIAKTQADLLQIMPKFVVILPESHVFPFKLDDYISKFSVDSATIYERNF